MKSFCDLLDDYLGALKNLEETKQPDLITPLPTLEAMQNRINSTRQTLDAYFNQEFKVGDEVYYLHDEHGWMPGKLDENLGNVQNVQWFALHGIGQYPVTKLKKRG